MTASAIRSAAPSRCAAASLRIGFVLALFWSTLGLAWVALSAVDFGYPLLYRALDIEQHVSRYAPQNRYGRQDFVTTDESERRRIVGEMIAAINHGGDGLSEITYTNPQGRRITFLREAEQIHLRSVARLIDGLRAASYGAFALLALSLALLWRLRLPPPPVSKVLLGALATVVLGAGAVIALGPERVFNTLHTWVFPAGEQWFFYYEESLMTALLKAPDLFGAMAVLWVALWLLLSAAAYAGAGRLLRRRAATARPRRA